MPDSKSLLPILQTLWTRSGLSRWAGTSMSLSWTTVHGLMFNGLGDAERRCGASITGINDEGEIRGSLFGEIIAVTPARDGYAITLRYKNQRCYATAELVAHAQTAYAHAWRAIGEPYSSVVALLIVDRSPKGHLRVLDLAAILCSATFLPCESMHDVAMANRLVAEQRFFEKPIRMHPVDDAFPDFVLLDTRPETHIEAYGGNDPVSDARRRKNRQRLRAGRDVTAIEWNIDSQSPDDVALPPPGRNA
ncbi:hypothetical protein F4827_006336 [Paraburkholderia bannensis]|uniref:Uncharacterized protein n=1 Tax=Paraburkholderia bannensis TaxID=765414 RepID=A0A7W9U548_9BURK|nr:DUF1173 family protein [Paraburkholderia bannensis]MBB6106461.1 hypothetical protein [Paraburkholderia bannensis]